MDTLSLKVLLESQLADTDEDWNYIFPWDLHQALQNGDPMFLLDLRKNEDYIRGHIPTSINIFWLDILKEKNLAMLPTDREIILICYVGHTASQVLVFLQLLGFQVSVLKFGMGTPPDPTMSVAGWKQLGFETVSD